MYSIKDSITISEIASIVDVDFSKTSKIFDGDVHDFPEIVYVTKGALYILVDGKEHILHSGDILIYAPNSYHILSRPSDASLQIISFKCRFENFEHLYNRVISLDAETQNEFTLLMKKAFKLFEFKKLGERFFLTVKPDIPAYKTEIFKKKLEIFILSLIGQTVSHKSTTDKYEKEFAAIMEVLKDNISANLSITDMAKMTAMSESKLKKIFREHINTSPITFFNNMKIEKSKELLLANKYSITEIAELLGFNSLHYFSRFFKKNIGITPSAYVTAFKNKEVVRMYHEI